MERERQRLVARKIKYARGKVRNGSTTMVTVEDSQGGLTEYCKKQDIEREILQNNKKLGNPTIAPLQKTSHPEFWI
jgi:hypothetical protein